VDLYEGTIKKKSKISKFWRGNRVKCINVSQINEKYEESAVWNIVTHTHTLWEHNLK